VSDVDVLEAGQAVEMIDDGDFIHVFLNPNGMLVGADWSRKSVLELISRSKCQLSGDMAASMGHGLACLDRGRYHFIATKKAPADIKEGEQLRTTNKGQNA
jgi:hypothetical protein